MLESLSFHAIVPTFLVAPSNRTVLSLDNKLFPKWQTMIHNKQIDARREFEVHIPRQQKRILSNILKHFCRLYKAVLWSALADGLNTTVSSTGMLNFHTVLCSIHAVRSRWFSQSVAIHAAFRCERDPTFSRLCYMANWLSKASKLKCITFQLSLFSKSS